MNALSTDCQYLFLHADQLRDPADPAGPIAFARFLIFSGYLNLGLILLKHILPDDPQYPSRKECRERHIIDAHQQANRQWLVRLDTPTDLQHGEFFMSAYNLYTDRTGRQLQRIAAFPEDTGQNHIAALVRRQRPQPIERDLYPPDYMWRDLFCAPHTGGKYPMLKPNAVTIHPSDFDPEIRSDTFLALAYTLARGDLEQLAASLIHVAHAEDRQARGLKSYLSLLPEITESIQTAPPYFVTQPFAGGRPGLFLSALDRLACYLESIGLGALADIIRTESPDPHTRRHHIPLVQTA